MQSVQQHTLLIFIPPLLISSIPSAEICSGKVNTFFQKMFYSGILTKSSKKKKRKKKVLFWCDSANSAPRVKYKQTWSSGMNAVRTHWPLLNRQTHLPLALSLICNGKRSVAPCFNNLFADEQKECLHVLSYPPFLSVTFTSPHAWLSIRFSAPRQDGFPTLWVISEISPAADWGSGVGRGTVIL